MKGVVVVSLVPFESRGRILGFHSLPCTVWWMFMSQTPVLLIFYSLFFIHNELSFSFSPNLSKETSCFVHMQHYVELLFVLVYASDKAPQLSVFIMFVWFVLATITHFEGNKDYSLCILFFSYPSITLLTILTFLLLLIHQY